MVHSGYVDEFSEREFIMFMEKGTDLFSDSQASSMVMRGSLSAELLLRIMLIHGSAHLNK